MAANFSYFVQLKKNRYFYVKLLLSRTLDFFMLFVALASRLVLNTLHSLEIAVHCPGASIE
jgi:hypothetical protein